jgi:hypothetical protein
MSVPLDMVQGLPVPLTPLVGREQEVAALIAVLRSDDVRLVTLTGPGGVGKTRLALAVAAAIAGDFADGVRAVSLGAIDDPGLVGPAIAHSLGVREAGDQPLVQQLAAHLRDASMLLLLDSCERVADETSLLSDLLAGCPRLKVLTTSRRVLHLMAEHLFPVPPMVVPGTAAMVRRRRAASMPSVCSTFARERRRPGSRSTSGTSATSPPFAAVSMACRSRSSWPPRAAGSFLRVCSWSGWSGGCRS